MIIKNFIHISASPHEHDWKFNTSLNTKHHINENDRYLSKLYNDTARTKATTNFMVTTINELIYDLNTCNLIMVL